MLVPHSEKIPIQEKAFSLFFSSKGSEGTGLGLFIASKITQEHGGNLKLESDLGEGSKFTVSLPKKISNTSAK